MGIVAVELYKTNLIIKGDSLVSLEQGVKEFQVEGYLGDSTGITAGLPVQLKGTVPARKANDFYYVGANDLIFKNLIVGKYYYFRVRSVTSTGEVSQWSPWVSEQVGDSTAGMSFISDSNYPKVLMDSSAVIFRVAIDQIPGDFKEFQWYYSRVAGNLTDTIAQKPTQPAYPSSKTVANMNPTTFSMNGSAIISEVSFSGDKTSWYHVWCKVVDKSGNSAPTKTLQNGGWFYVGCGKVLAYNPQTDQDNVPPDSTRSIKISVDIPNTAWIGETIA